MIPKRLYESFKTNFPWFVDHVKKYKGNKETGGIDIFMDDGSVLNYQMNRTGWLLKRGGFHDDPT